MCVCVCDVCVSVSVCHVCVCESVCVCVCDVSISVMLCVHSVCFQCLLSILLSGNTSAAPLVSVHVTNLRDSLSVRRCTSSAENAHYVKRFSTHTTGIIIYYTTVCSDNTIDKWISSPFTHHTHCLPLSQTVPPCIFKQVSSSTVVCASWFTNTWHSLSIHVFFSLYISSYIL